MKPMVERADGWTDWIFPQMLNYRLVCCDCGLAHDMEFKVVEVDYTEDGFVVKEEYATPRWRVKFRARQNARSTAQRRRRR